MKIVLDTDDIITMLKEKYQTEEVIEMNGEFKILNASLLKEVQE